MNQTMSFPVELGKVVATQGALAKVDSFYMIKLLRLHRMGNWGVLDDEDWEANDNALANGGRILSAYPINPNEPNGEKVWIITEADRSVTTYLLPSEY